MQIPVLVERVKGNGYRARQGSLRPQRQGRLARASLGQTPGENSKMPENGSEIVALEVGQAPHPLAEFAGMFNHDADFADVLKIMADNRRKRMNEDADVP